MKRKITTCFATLVVLFFTAGLQVLQAGETIEKVLVDKNFEVNRDANLKISHEFGKVYCKNWDKSEISIKIMAKITARNADKANSLMDRIKTSVSGNRSEVEASCRLSSGKNDGSQNIEITMEVMMPRWVNLDLAHSFGSAWVGEVTGDAKIESEYGDLVITSLTGKNNHVEMSFGKATIDKASDMDMEVSYGKLILGQMTNVKLESEFSDVSVDELLQANVELQGGNFEVETMQDIQGESEFTNIKIGRLSTAAHLEMSYGGLTIKSLSKDFSIISLDTEFSNVTIEVEGGASYKLKVDTDFGNLSFPEKEALISKDIREIGERSVEAVIGANTNPNPLISVNSNYGSVKIN